MFYFLSIEFVSNSRFFPLKRKSIFCSINTFSNPPSAERFPNPSEIYVFANCLAFKLRCRGEVPMYIEFVLFHISVSIAVERGTGVIVNWTFLNRRFK